jgi:hypothetical protein
MPGAIEGFRGTSRFVVEGRLGEGGMGVVHQVRDVDSADLGYLAACARHRRGELEGGDAGSEQVDRSRAFFEAQGIENIERCLAMSAPGFER